MLLLMCHTANQPTRFNHSSTASGSRGKARLLYQAAALYLHTHTLASRSCRPRLAALLLLAPVEACCLLAAAAVAARACTFSCCLSLRIVSFLKSLRLHGLQQ